MNRISENWHISPELRELKLQYQTGGRKASEWKITNPVVAAHYMRSLMDEQLMEIKEQFLVVLLNNAKNVLGWSKISVGGKQATIVDVSEVVAIAILSNASSVIVAHNHPSGQLEASSADKKLTDRLKQALTLHGLSLDDHIILTHEEYGSFKENGLL